MESVIPHISAFPSELPTKAPHSSMKKQSPSMLSDGQSHRNDGDKHSFSLPQQQHLTTTLSEFFRMCDAVLAKYKTLLQPSDIRRVSSSTGTSSSEPGSSVLQKTTSTRSSLPSASMSSGGFVASPYASGTNVGGRHSQSQGMQHAAVFAPVMAMDAISRLGSGDADDASFLQLLQSVVLGASLSTTTGATGGSQSGANSMSLGGAQQRVVTASRTTYASRSPMKPPATNAYLGSLPPSSSSSPRNQLHAQTTAPGGAGSFTDAEGRSSEPFDTFPVDLAPSDEDLTGAPQPAKNLSANDRRGLVLFSPSAVDDPQPPAPPPKDASSSTKRPSSQFLSTQQPQPQQQQQQQQQHASTDESGARGGRSAHNSLWSEVALFGGGNSPQQLSTVLPSILASMGLSNWENLEVGRERCGSESNGPSAEAKEHNGGYSIQLVSGLLSKNLLKDLLIVFEYIETLKSVWTSLLSSKALGGSDSGPSSNSGSGKKEFPELPAEVGHRFKSTALNNSAQLNVNLRTNDNGHHPPSYLHRTEGDAFDEDKGTTLGHNHRNDADGSHSKMFPIGHDDLAAAVSGTSSGETTPRGDASSQGHKRRASSNHSGGSEIVDGDELNDVHVNTEDNAQQSPTTVNNNLNSSLHSTHSAASSLHSAEGPSGLFSHLTSPVVQSQAYHHSGATPPAIQIYEGSTRGHPPVTRASPGTAVQSAAVSNLVSLGARHSSHSSYVHSTSPMLINILPTSSQKKMAGEGVGGTSGDRIFSPNHVGIAKFPQQQQQPETYAMIEAHHLPTELGSFCTTVGAVGTQHPFTVRAQRFGTDEDESPREEKIVVAKKVAVSRPALALFSTTKGNESPESAAVGASTSTVCPTAPPHHTDESSTQTPSTDDEASPPLKTELPTGHRHDTAHVDGDRCLAPHPPSTATTTMTSHDGERKPPQLSPGKGKPVGASADVKTKGATMNLPSHATNRSGSQAMSANGMMSVMNPAGVASSLLVSVDWESRSDVSRYSMQSGETFGQFSPGEQPPHPAAVLPRQSNYRSLSPRMKLLDDVMHRYSSAKATFQLVPVLNDKYLLLCGIGHFLGSRGGGGKNTPQLQHLPSSLLEPSMSEEVMVVLHLESYRRMVLKIFSGSHSILLGGHRHSGPGVEGGNMAAARKIKDAKRAAALQDLERLRQLRHPHLVTLFDVFDDDDAERLYLVMEYARHGSIGTVLEDGTCTTKLNTEALIRVAFAVASALAYLHKEGVPHRNLCPENILVDRDNNVLVGGAGLPEECSRHSFLTNAFSPIQNVTAGGFPLPSESTTPSTLSPLFEADILALGRTLILLWDDEHAKQELMKPGRNTMTSLFMYPHPPQGVNLTVEKSSVNAGSSSSRVLARKSFSYTLPPQDRPPLSVDVSPLTGWTEASPAPVATNLTISQHVPSSSCGVESNDAPLGSDRAIAPTMSNSAFGSGRDSSSTPSERSDEPSPPNVKLLFSDGMRRLIESCLQVNGNMRPAAQNIQSVLEEYMLLLDCGNSHHL